MKRWVYIQVYATQPRELPDGSPNPEFPQLAFRYTLVETIKYDDYDEAISLGWKVLGKIEGLMNDHVVELKG